MKGNGEIYDGHKLFLKAFSNNEAKSWVHVFTPNGNDDVDTNGTGCQCYKRFVMCGYSVAERDDDAKCENSLSQAGLLPTIYGTLCQHGISLNTMLNMDEEKLATVLSKVITDNATAVQKQVTKHLRENHINVVLNQPSRASSVSGSFHPRYAFDGILDTHWVSERSDNQTLTVNMMSLYNISKVVIVWMERESGAYDIQVSSDEIRWTTVWSQPSESAVTGTVESVLANNVTCQYVRMQGTKRSSKW